MTISVAFFNCPHCVDSFAFDWQKIKGLALYSRVMVSCPGCGNTVEVVMNSYSLIHNCEQTNYQWGEILEVLPPDPKTAEESIRRNIQLHYEIYQKKSNWRPG